MATKPGKLVAMKAVSSTCTGFSLASPITSAAIAMRWSMWVATVPPPARGRAVHDQIVALDLDVDAVSAQHRRGGGEAVGFLDAQLLQSAHARRALGERGGDREDRIFVDHRGRALGRHRRRP